MFNSIQDSVMQLLPNKRKTNSTSGWASFNAPCCHHNGESADTRGRGGNGANSGTNVTGSAGANNTGNGGGAGGAASSSYANGGSGGSGIVVLSY